MARLGRRVPRRFTRGVFVAPAPTVPALLGALSPPAGVAVGALLPPPSLPPHYCHRAAQWTPVTVPDPVPARLVLQPC